jgi:hypothetical protein
VSSTGRRNTGRDFRLWRSRQDYRRQGAEPNLGPKATRWSAPAVVLEQFYR